MSEILAALQTASFQNGLERHWSCHDMSMAFSTMGAKTLILSEEDKPIAFLLWRAVLDEAEILMICVLPEYRGRGHGGKMLEVLYDNLAIEGVHEVFLEVSENNKAAIALYQKNAFKIVGRRKNYYGDKGIQQQDALIMQYILPKVML
ncbi:MAG: ribosomal protein S18-alanine N-acetyltransferase [Emcibacter sp.]|nr:ribosomal protein S18-alanine N-acetyltransferase [Emcibacter sp.]